MHPKSQMGVKGPELRLLATTPASPTTAGLTCVISLATIQSDKEHREFPFFFLMILMLFKLIL